VNAQMDSGITPIHLAVREGRRALTRLLIANGADPNIPDSTGRYV
jgi:ankyrin repeat protein